MEHLLSWPLANPGPVCKPLGVAHLRRKIGKGIDAVFASRGESYALFPMIAKQSTSRSDHLSEEKRKDINKLRHLITRTRLRELIMSHFMQANEILVAVKSLALR